MAAPSGAGARRAASGGSGGGGGRRRFIDYPRSDRDGWRRWIPSWRLLLGLFLTGVLLVFAALAVAYASVKVPSPNDFADNQTTTVYYADGETEMGTFGEQNRQLVEGDTIPQHVKDAVVAAEDRSFYENPGINPAGLVRALWNNLSGGDRQGGSSITQQYAERYYFQETVSDYRGKFKEALLAVKLARQQDKDEILSNYLNTIYFGRDAYGIETAAQSYFGVPSSELTISQGALIAGVIPSPNNWDPRKDPEKAEERWNYVLDGMVTIGTLTQAERDAQEFPETIEYSRSDTYAGPVGYLLDTVRTEITTRSPITEEDLDTVGFKIVTTIDKPKQDAAVAAVAEELPGDQAPNLRTALVSIDPADGAIKAMYGGPDYLTVSRNAVTQDTMQAGSTFKPFTLVAYLEGGNSLRSRYDGKSGVEVEGWDDPVTNFGDQSFGRIDVVDATADSVNSVYAQMNAEVGPEQTLAVASRAGLSERALENQQFASNVLGTASPTPLDMAQAYSTFAAQGLRTEPFIVRTVEYLDGGVAYEGAQPGERQFEEDIMADTTYALTQVVERGSGSKAQALDRPVAGKTGTSNENKSAWFIGYTPQLATAVSLYQVGEAAAEPITPFGGLSQITGGSFPAAIWTAYMIPAMEGMEVVPFPERADVGEPNVVDVPSVVGLSEADARTALEEAGLAVAVQQAPSSNVAEGLVASQSVTGEVQSGTTVTITVSTGPELVAVPNVVGSNVDDAAGRLSGLGLRVTVTEQENEAPEGQVLSQNPTGGEVEVGSTVALVVSSGPPEPEPEPEPEPTTPVDPDPEPTTPVEPPEDQGAQPRPTLPPGQEP